ncbi:MAG: nucleotide exchange factor GrpE, partial [Anaerolineales bacterium]|nr:nucleotide exchange factor GrpE [Anaerolineales bacterium]
MTDKKKLKHEEKFNETQASTETIPIDGEQIDVKIEALRSQLAEVESKASEYTDGWARSQAEFQNYKKRIER